MDMTKDSLSVRGRKLAAQKPAFLDVLSDLWDVKSNPDGIVNIGLAENVRRIQVIFNFIV